jgi:cardiolipin synthase C
VHWAWVTIAVFATLVVLAMLATWSYAAFVGKVEKHESHALEASDTTSLDRYALELCRDRGASSGIVLLTSSIDAFMARSLAVRGAGRSLDLMYYMWNADITGMLLMREVVAAADRGVRVRILLDDLGVSMSDRIFHAIDCHPNIELRLFNPTKARGNVIRRGLEMVLRFRSVNRRMHNKAFIADGRIAIVGGRNIGDAYFDAGKQSNFRDFDLVMAGEAVTQSERVFDEYWNSTVAVPVRALLSRRPDRLEKLRRYMESFAASPRAAAYLDQAASLGSLSDRVAPDAYVWVARLKVLADPPEKAAGKRRKGRNQLMDDLLPIMTGSSRALNVTSPYFIPGKRGVASLTALSGKGVAVKILTNSLAATDVAAVHAGYSKYRPDLLDGGVMLYELKAAAGRGKLSLRGSGRGASQASLHTKAFTSDGTLGFVGSLNLDPRSVSLNTEMGVLFRSQALVRRMDDVFAEEIEGRMSYSVRMANDGLCWVSPEQGGNAVFTKEPDAGVARRLVVWCVGLLPLESQL